MELEKLKQIEQGIVFMQNLISKMPRNYPQVIKMQSELDEVIFKYKEECKNHEGYEPIV